MPLTDVQQLILDAIVRLSGGPRPRPPTVRELAQALGRAPSTIVGHLYRLEHLGRIVRDGTPRGLWVVPGVAQIADARARAADDDPGALGRTG